MNRVLLIVAVLLLTSGCASHSKRVECTGRLEPINAPTPPSPTPPAAGQP